MARWKWPSFARRQPASPRAAFQDSGGGVVVSTSEQLADALRGGVESGSGVSVTPSSAMRVGAVYRCVTLRAGVVANMPLHVKRRVDPRTREDASDHPLWKLLRRKPNRWQTPSQFRRMMQTHLLLRGNAYAMKVESRGAIVELIPLHPDRVECKQLDDLSLSYAYTRKNGARVVLAQSEVMHLVGLTLDGVHGVSAITFARETIGLALAQEDHGASTFKNGARVSAALSHPGKLGLEGQGILRSSLDDFRAGGEREGKVLILEEGMTYSPMAMTAEDAQWIESRKFSRTDIAMFFGVPPHMIGDTEKSTSWGTGIDAQTQGFVTFTSEDDLTTWEETINRDLVADDEPDIFARFNRAALVRGDIKARWDSYLKGRQLKVYSANDVRELEDLNPVEGGDIYENPMIQVDRPSEGERDEPAQTA